MNNPEQPIKKKWYFFYPDETIFMIWETILTAVLLNSVFITPYTLAFPNTQDDDKSFGYFLNFIDIMFYIDLFATFFKAYQREDFAMEHDLKNVAVNYIKGWFFLDLISVLPFDVAIVKSTLYRSLSFETISLIKSKSYAALKVPDIRIFSGFGEDLFG